MKKFAIQFISDLHLEYCNKIPNIIAKQKYLALLGDIGNPRIKNYNEFLKHLSPNFDKIFLISGNHEYWNLPNFDTKYNKQEVDNLINDIANKYNNVIYMNNKSITTDEGIHIIGNTLWSQIPKDKLDESKYIMGDCRNIYMDNDKILPDQINILNENCVNFIKNEIKLNNDKKVVVLSHHCPTHDYLIEKYISSPNNYAFVNKLNYLVKNPVYAWLAGHTHGNIHKIINGVICSSNCRGYTKQNLTDYDPEKYIEI